MSVTSSDRWVREIDVISTRFAEFEAVMAKISKKAAKLDRMPIIWNVIGVTQVEVVIDGQPQTVGCSRVEIFGEDCKIDGYRPLATVEIAGEDRAVIEGYGMRESDDRLIEKYDALIRSRAGQCDHCNENRLRKYSVVMINDEIDVEDIKIVGRTCINDFCKNSFDMLSYLGWLKNTVDGLSGWTMPKDHYTPTFEFLTAVASIARRTGGYVSQNKALGTGRRPTMDYYYRLFSGGVLHKDAPADAKPTAADEQLAREVIAFVNALVPEEGSGMFTYQQNLRDLMAGVSCFASKKAALAASAIGYYQGHIDHQERQQAQVVATRAAPAAPTGPVSQHVGVVGQRLKHVAVKFLSKKYLGEGDYGPRYLYRMVTLGGDVVNYFTTASLKMDADKSYVVSFGVKKHDEFRGVKQTVIGRMTNHGEVK